jgi:glycosyltransferase involved in cell wall biosynthesis
MSISVVIPVYNTERFVRAALESVFAQEGDAEVQVVVVDDGSTDGSVEVVRGFGERVTLVLAEHGGIGAARNRGVELTTGEYLAFLDADDLWTPAKLRLQLDALTAPGAPEMVAGMVEQFRDGPEGRGRVGDLMAGYVAGAMLMRRETFERVGPFQTGIRAGEFIDWYARAEEMGLTCMVLPETVLHRRIHDANTARTSGDNNKDTISVLRATLQRRRTTQ